MNFKSLIAGFLCVVSLAGFAAGGKSYKTAAELKSSQTAKLVDDGDGEGVAWFKKTLTKYQSYSVWIKGPGAPYFDLTTDADPSMTKEDTPQADFMDGDFGDDYQVLWMYEDDWDEDDPRSYTFYFCVSGEVGDSITLGFSTGIKSFKDVGEEDNPKSLTFTDKEQPLSANLLPQAGNAYYIKAKLAAGRKFLMRTEKGTAEKPLVLVTDAALDVYEDTRYDTVNNSAFVLYSAETANYDFMVAGSNAYAFTVKYQSVPTRKPAEHGPVALTAANDYRQTFVPGARVFDLDFYDQVIDRNLCSISLKKGERWFFETEGALKPLALEVYDKDGNVVASNGTMGNGVFDCRAAIEVGADGTYYIGVCDPALGEGEEPQGGEGITLSARKCDSVEKPDAFDPADDELTAGTQISPKPALAADDPRQVGDANGPHALNAGDWYDCFRIGGRKDIAYCLQADFVGLRTDLGLVAHVYRYKDKKLIEVETTGSISPDALHPLVFLSEENTDYYVRISVDGGVGLDFPAYTLYSSAYSTTGEDLGILKVTTPGAPGAQWSVNAEKTKYADGTSILIAGSPKVTFYEVSGFKTPQPQTVSVVAGTAVTSCEGVYVDKSDPADDVRGKAVSITPASKGATARRTLWEDDEHDWFKFTAKTGTFYNFTVADPTADAVMTIFGSDGETPIDGDSVDIGSKAKFSLPAGTYYIDVHHSGLTVEKGGSYSLVYSSATVGAIAFAKTAVSVKENATYVDLAVKRTASEGEVRVDYTTVAGTAQPGSEYYPASGELFWKNGDKADKKIRVRLIPDLVAQYEANKSFRVVLWPKDRDDLAENEYLAQITAPTSTVTITEVSKAAPGTVAVTAINGKATVAKKPVATVTAGGNLEFTVSRNGGADGRICVRWEAVKGKALPGKDFVAASGYLQWEDGDMTDRTFTVQTLPSTDYTATKTFTVKFAAQTSGEYKGWSKPSLAASAATMTIGNDRVTTPIGDYIKTIDKASGVSLKASGTWFIASDGRLSSDKPLTGKKDVLTFTLTGPGVFSVKPTVSGNAKLSCQVGKEPAFECGSEFVRLLASGSQQVVFTLTGDGTGSAAFDLYPDGKSYEWLSLASLVPTPAVKAVIPLTGRRLSWKVPEGSTAAAKLRYRVRFGTNSKSLTETVYQGAETSCALPTLEAGKTYYWVVDAAYDATGLGEDLVWIAGKTQWSFSAAAAGVPVTVISSSDGAEATDVWGDPIESDGEVLLLQGVKVAWQLGAEDDDGTTYKIVNGKLPDGIKLDSRTGKISGVPTKVGSYSAVLQTLNGKKAGETLAYRFRVSGIDLAAGTFRGTLREDGDALETGFQKAASLVFTSTTAGKLSGKVTLGGKTYSFSGTGFDLAFDRDDGSDGFTAKLQAVLNLTTKIANVSYPNVLTVTLGNGSSKSLAALGLVSGTAELSMTVPSADGKSVLGEEVAYVCDLYRDNSKNGDYLAAIADFAGYYTAALAPVSAEAGWPQGNGYMTLTVDAKSGVKVGGMLADGTKISFSTVGLLTGDLSAPRTCVFRVPLFAAKSPYVFGGEVGIVFAEDAAGNAASILDASSELLWNNDSKTACFDEAGFRIGISPVGGWYSTVYSLQRYYLNSEFTLDGIAVELNGDAISLKSAKGEIFSDMKFSLTRKTGLLSGSLTYDGSKGVKCYGVLPLNRDALSPLDANVWSAGFFTRKVKDESRTVTESLPFDILMDETDPDWSETVPPDAQ